MNYRLILCLLLIVAMVGVVSADTLIVFTSSTQDGYAQQGLSGGENDWSTLTGGTGQFEGYQYTVIGPIFSSHASTSNKWKYLQRAELWFNTSPLTSGATISSAKLVLYGTAESCSDYPGTTISWQLVTPTYPTYWPYAEDYDNFYGSAVTESVAYNAGWLAANNFTVTNTSAINKTGFTYLMGRNNWDTTNTAPTWVADKSCTCRYLSGDYSGAEKPSIQIVYTTGGGGDTTPPASITNLANITTTCTAINWTWTNPADADFNHTYVMKDNVWYANISNTTSYSLWTGLTGGTSYTFSSKTVDITGNMNATWVNQTATATSCPDTTPPASITSFSSNSVTCTEENITWVNPADADFNHTQMYKDNVWQINETNTTTFHKFTGLNSWQSYTYSTHTCDLTGNCNTTWVNQTVATSPICKIINYIRQFYLAEAVIT